jgi:hypothetical protein
MKNLIKTDFVIYDKANDHVLQDSYGRVILFGNKDEALDDCHNNESVIPCTELSDYWKQVITYQINN